MSVELANALSSLISVDNLEEAQMQADLLNAAGIFLTVFGFVVGGAMIGATTAIVGLGARLMSDDINNRIDQEISRSIRKMIFLPQFELGVFRKQSPAVQHVGKVKT